MIKVFIFIMVLAIPFVPAHASYVLECKVNVFVEGPNKTKGGYSVTVLEAVVTGGHGKIGELCLEKVTGKSIDIKSKDPLVTDSHPDLKYDYYNAMGAKGFLESKKWSLWPAEEAELDEEVELDEEAELDIEEETQNKNMAEGFMKAIRGIMSGKKNEEHHDQP